MAKPNPDVEMISAPNMLQVKVGGTISQGDLHLTEKAEEALKGATHILVTHGEEEVEKLETGAKAVATKKKKGDEGEELFIRAHDLRGLGTTYEFPIITRLAGSLTKLIDLPEKREKASKNLALAHVGAIRAALSQNIRSDDDQVAGELAAELEEQSIAFAQPWGDE